MQNHENEPQLNLAVSAVAPEAGPAPVVNVRDGEVFASSRDVAAFFEKQHKDVLRAIKLLNCSTEFTERNFALFKIKDITKSEGESTSHIDMSKDGFVFLAMGFTGAKAAAFKERYIEAFNRMEAELRARPRAMIDFTDPKVLIGCLTALQEQVAEKEAKLAIQGQRLEKLDLIEGAEGSMCISTAAKTLGVNPIKNLFATLQAHRWIFKRPNTSDWLAHQE